MIGGGKRTLLRILLPVFATWVGTVLAYYYGRENFESASREVQTTNAQFLEMARLTREQREARPISEIMLVIAEVWLGAVLVVSAPTPDYFVLDL